MKIFQAPKSTVKENTIASSVKTHQRRYPIAIPPKTMTVVDTAINPTLGKQANITKVTTPHITSSLTIVLMEWLAVLLALRQTSSAINANDRTSTRVAANIGKNAGDISSSLAAGWVLTGTSQTSAKIATAARQAAVAISVRKTELLLGIYLVFSITSLSPFAVVTISAARAFAPTNLTGNFNLFVTRSEKSAALSHRMDI